jgi:phosphoglycolate phosphatase-like HAD superfamily hydrolase
VENPKPSPDQLIKILEHFNIEPYQLIYIGDSKLDEIAAKAAGRKLWNLNWNQKIKENSFAINTHGN